MKFATGAQVLSTLTTKTSESSEDLGVLVRQLAEAGEPLQGAFNGAARAAFDAFSAETDRIASDLSAALAAVLGGITRMDRSFGDGDQQMADETDRVVRSTSFESARFGAARV